MQEEIVCKTLMFVQISPSATDLEETLCSLNFASQVRGIETGPADLSELFKYKQMGVCVCCSCVMKFLLSQFLLS